ncbi:MAG: hypothetical protein WB581_10075 [Halobacteriota archaeon]
MTEFAGCGKRYGKLCAAVFAALKQSHLCPFDNSSQLLTNNVG